MRVVLSIVLVFFLFSCQKHTDHKENVHKGEDHLQKMNMTYPFSENGKIELLSYKDRRFYTRNIYEDSIYYSFINDKEKIIERVELNEKLRLKLYKLYFTKECSNTVSPACYDPRHSIVFYDKEYQIIGSIEICFDCGTKMRRGDIKPKAVCRENDGKLLAIFKEAGIKYFGENE